MATVYGPGGRETNASRARKTHYGATTFAQRAAANAYRRNPSTNAGIAAAEAGLNIPYEQLYEDLVLNPENERLREQEQGIRQQAQTSTAASAARNRQAVGRLGLQGTGFEDALRGSLTSSMASRLSDTINQRKAKFAEEINSPNRLDPLNRVRDARIGKIQDNLAVDQGITQGETIVGSALSAFPLTAPIGVGINVGAGLRNLFTGIGANEEISKARSEYNAGDYRRPNMLQPNTSISGSSLNSQGGSQRARYRQNPLEDESALGGFRF